MERSRQIATIPLGSWGIAFSKMQAEAGHSVKGVFHDPEDFYPFFTNRQYPKRFSEEVVFPQNLAATQTALEALEGAEIVVLAPASKYLRSLYQEIRQYIPQETAIVCLTKGLERGSNLTASQVLAEEDYEITQRLAIISGPNFAADAVSQRFMATTLASRSNALASKLQADLSTPLFRIYTQEDVLGVELCGAVKHAIAFAAGMGDGLDMGVSARYALINRGLEEMARFVEYFGGQRQTVFGLSGEGDLNAASSSDLSRNHRKGKELAQGLETVESLFNGNTTVEGLYSVKAVRDLAAKEGIIMPITEAVYDVLYRGISPKAASISLMTRPLVHENGVKVS